MVAQNTDEPTFAILPQDDDWGRKWFQQMEFTTKLSYGFGDDAQIYATNINQQSESTNFTLHSNGLSNPIDTHLVGKFNVANIMAAR